MKNLIFKFFAFFAILAMFSSCSNKESLNPSQQAQLDVQTSSSTTTTTELPPILEYRIDNVVVAPFTLSEADSIYTILIEGGIDIPNQNQKKQIIHKFTTQQKYHDYGVLKGVKAKECDQITERLAFLADSLGMEQLVSSPNDTIPTWWYNLEKAVYHQYIPNSIVSLNGASERALFTQINNDMRYGCSNGESKKSIICSFGVGIPSLWIFGWCNDPSGFYPVGFIGGVNMAWDKPFYSKKLFNYWNWGLSGVDLCSAYGLAPTNNRACSWWTGGL